MLKHVACLYFIHFDKLVFVTSIPVHWYAKLERKSTILLVLWIQVQILKGQLVFNLHKRYMSAHFIYVYALDDIFLLIHWFHGVGIIWKCSFWDHAWCSWRDNEICPSADASRWHAKDATSGHAGL